MQYKCTICNKDAKYVIKGTTTAYCEEHATECFGDTSYLASVQEEAKRLSEIIADRMDQFEQEGTLPKDSDSQE